MRFLIIPILLVLGACSSAGTSIAAKDQVMVLSTLHQLHEETTYYGYRDLAAIIKFYNPDIIMVELTQTDLDERRPQNTKREYSEAVYPYLNSHNVQAIPLEPSEPLFSELVGQFRSAINEGYESNQSEAEAFQTYNVALLDMLLSTWKSPADVNSTLTDKLYESKHEIQDRVFGEAHADAWERWNQNFLNRINNAASQDGANRILVLVGAEHGYWMRRELSDFPGLELLSTETYLRSDTK